MRHPIHQNKTMRDVRQQTRAKIQHLTALGYRVKEMWECEWQRIIQSDNHLKEFVETLDIVTPLNPREAFFGGRTNAIKLHHKVEENEQIHYSDMILLYPCANLECEYPIRHTEFIKFYPPIISSPITIQVRLQTPYSHKTATHKQQKK